jgi:hypothetical protein
MAPVFPALKKRIDFSARQQLESLCDGGMRLLLECAGGMFLHANHLGGVVQCERFPREAIGLHPGFSHFCIPNQVQRNRVRLQVQIPANAQQDFGRGVVAPHQVYSNAKGHKCKNPVTAIAGSGIQDSLFNQSARSGAFSATSLPL